MELVAVVFQLRRADVVLELVFGVGQRAVHGGEDVLLVFFAFEELAFDFFELDVFRQDIPQLGLVAGKLVLHFLQHFFLLLFIASLCCLDGISRLETLHTPCYHNLLVTLTCQ